MITPGLFRLFLAMLVALHHSFPLRLGGWAVGTFFILSGFWISRMWRTKYSGMRSPYLAFISSRWWRIAPLLFAVNLIAVAINLSGFRIGNPNAMNDWAWWLSQPAIVGSTWITRLLPPAWSLDVEMQFYILAPLILIAIARLGGATFGLLAAVLACWSGLQFANGMTFEASRLDPYAWIFAIGCLAEQSGWRPSNRLAWLSAAATILAIVAVISLPQTRGLVWRAGAEAAEVSVAASFAFFFLMLICGFPFAIGTTYVKSSNWDRWLGDLSYPVYLFHWIPRDWYYQNVDWSLPMFRNLVLLGINFMVALLGAVMLLQFVDRPIQSFAAKRRTTSCETPAAKPLSMMPND